MMSTSLNKFTDPVRPSNVPNRAVFKYAGTYLYYSFGDGSSMQIRMAVSESIVGPFEDCGVRLASQDFAIAPHVVNENYGRRWLLYVTDFLLLSPIGTGNIRDQRTQLTDDRTR